MDIEHQLSTLKPLGQARLAHRILQSSLHRRQRRRDCVFGFGGLLTGIAATLLVMVFISAPNVEVAHTYEHSDVSPTVDIDQSDRVETLAERREVPALPLVRDYEPIDLDEWIARYERLLRHRREIASRNVAPRRNILVSPDGINPLEYRNRLMLEI